MRLAKTGLVVECHSGHTYAERPTAFWWEGERLEIDTISAEWRSPERKYFRVKVKNEKVFELTYNQASDDWQVEQM